MFVKKTHFTYFKSDDVHICIYCFFNHASIYIYAYIHTYIHTYVHIYTYIYILLLFHSLILYYVVLRFIIS